MQELRQEITVNRKIPVNLDSKVLELRNVGDSKSQCYFNLASTLGLEYFYTLSNGDHQDTIPADFTVELEALESVLDLMEKK